MKKAALVLAILAASCDNGRGDGPEPGGPDAATDVRGDAPAVHVMTSATPGVPSAHLTEAHAGWRKASCTECHPEAHRADFPLTACVSCHGPNGAPPREVRAQHGANDGCAGCHGDAHGGALPETASCRACHGFQLPAGDGCGTTETVDVVVIGGGGGGLAAAAALARGGRDVVLLEQAYAVGGCMRTFSRAGYRFEASLHGFDGLDADDGMNSAMFQALGIADKVKVVHNDPMYQAVYPDFTYMIPADVEAYRALLMEEFPLEAEGVDALFNELLDLYRILGAVLAAQAEGRGLPEDVSVEELQKLAGMMELTLQDVVDQYLTDPKLIALWTQLAGFAGTRPDEVSALFFIAMWCSYHVGGYYYFEGGSGALAEALAEVIEEAGGRVLTNSRVVAIDVEDGLARRVRTEDGRCFDTGWVVSNAPAGATMLEMIGEEHLPGDYAARLKEMSIGLSAFVIHLGVDADLRDAFPGTHGIMINEGYDTTAIFDAVTACAPEETAIAISNYSVSDPTAAPPGKNAIVIVTQLGYECWDQWLAASSYDEYLARKEELAQLFLARAEAWLPGLSEHIEVMAVSTPRTIEAFTLNPGGTIF
ncbi:MAG: FAD-dependent oxidoreductase, partial [Deltaproteobacteria bacterium]|nr:FAD-dependent oxidoreductase [Deltaproteobacteria bacterium]